MATKEEIYIQVLSEKLAYPIDRTRDLFNRFGTLKLREEISPKEARDLAVKLQPLTKEQVFDCLMQEGEKKPRHRHH